jgi:transcriptional regulator of arginine metabolism
MPQVSTKRTRQHTIVQLVRTQRVRSQDELRRLLLERGFNVTQATLSRDLRELRVAKVPHAEGESYYSIASDPEEMGPTLGRLLPHLFLSVEGVSNLIVVKTLTGSAQAVAEAIDIEEWPELLGTIAGDDTILIVLRDSDQRGEIIGRIGRIAER